MKIESWNIERVIPYARNPRKNDLAVAGVKASIKEFGFQQPIVVDKDGVIVAGHTRHKAAIELGLTKVPVTIADNLTPQQIKAYRILDNKTGERAEWDSELLAAELEDLPEFDFGEFEENDGEVDTTEDEVPEVSEADPVSRLGDVWLLGRHKVYCCDIVDAKALPDCEIVVTDPPYSSGAKQEAAKKGSTSVGTRGSVSGEISRDNLTTKGYLSLMRWAYSLAEKSNEFYIFTDWRMWPWTCESAELAGVSVGSMIVWNKGSSGLGNQWGNQHELILFGKKSFCNTGRLKGNVITIARTANEIHPTQKPVEVLVEILEHTDSGKVLDPFLGSGTTLIACERLGRICYGCEISPKYVDVICKRYYNETGIVPTLESTGEPFPVEQ